MKSHGRVLPEAIPLRLTQIQITGELTSLNTLCKEKQNNARDICCLKFQLTSGLMYCGRGDGSDFSVEVDQVATSEQLFRKNVDISFLFLCLTILKVFRKFVDFSSLFSAQGRGNTVFRANFGNLLNCKPEYDAGKDLLTVQVIHIFQLKKHIFESITVPNWEPTCFFQSSTTQIVNCPTIRGDTRVLFQSSSDQVFINNIWLINPVIWYYLHP